MLDPRRLYNVEEAREQLGIGRAAWQKLRREIEHHIRKVGQKDFVLGRHVIDQIENQGETENVGSSEHIGVV